MPGHCAGAGDAGSKLVVVLHITDSQKDDILADIQEHPRVYRKLSGRLLLVEHKRQPGFVWSPKAKAFVADPVSGSMLMLQCLYS
jgi:hypothetical protein